MVEFVQTPLGKGVLLVAFGFFLFLLQPARWAPLTGLLVFFSFWPQWRKTLLLVAGLLWIALGYTEFHWQDTIVPYLHGGGIPDFLLNSQGAVLLVASVFLLNALCVYVVGRSPLAGRIHRPVALLIGCYFLLLCVLSYVPAPSSVKAVFWVVAFVWGKYLWYLCYSLRECRSGHPPDFINEAAHYLPFWRPLHVPIPKGSRYMAAIEAKTPRDLGVVQLKGLKLIIWAFVLMMSGLVLRGVLYGGESVSTGFGLLEVKRQAGMLRLQLAGRPLLNLPFFPTDLAVPSIFEALDLSAAGKPFPFYTGWIVLLVYFFNVVINLIVEFHVAIALCRMCGYNALRNSYKPLYSQSIAEFWNRLYYYFKELLVFFFFYPAFFRYFKKHPRLRLFFATFAAACFGNFIYHLFRDFGFIVERGIFRAALDFYSYFVYSFVLTIGIFVSQLRFEKYGRIKHGPLARIVSSVRVFVFFSLLSVFLDERREGLAKPFAFFLSLFNISMG